MKLNLRLEDLEVDAFQTTSIPDERGTVWGQQCTCDPGVPTCDEGLSCFATCQVSCATCDYFNPTCFPHNCNTFDRNPPCM
jgi:hypothetical protein